ncbi:SRPBCC family protein [soil metagenome]
MAELVVVQDVDASVERTWERLVDWESQGQWMLGTRVRGTAQDGVGVGGGLEGWTGIGRLGFLDTMVITQWQPPHRCVVRHTGRLLRGAGAFEVEPAGDTIGGTIGDSAGGRCRVVWSEWVDPPFGLLGQLGWVVAGPVVRLGVQLSLRRFARAVEADAASSKR